jgi:5-formyltetrahydrofolate cyclo-ligase
VNASELKRAKRRVRARVLELRDGMPPSERERAGREIVDRLRSLPELERARTVMAFWSFGSEVSTEPLLSALHGRGVIVALPRIVERDLEARSYEPGDPLTVAPFGAAEPSGGRVIPPVEIDVIVTPGVAFDRAGARVGYGGGYYDRFFPKARVDALRAGIAFDVQVVEEPLPRGSFDLPLDVLVTERRTLRFPRSG